MNTRPPIMTFTPTASEPPRRPADFLQPLARRVDQKPMIGSAQQETRRLTVPRGITLKGAVAGCQRLTVEGQVEAALSDCLVLEIAENGCFIGQATVEQADVRGRIEGELTVLGRLQVRATGRVSGRIRYQDLSIEPGGKLAGQVELLEGEPEEAEETASGEAALRAVPQPAGAPRFALATAEGAGPSDDGHTR